MMILFDHNGLCSLSDIFIERAWLVMSLND